MISKLGRTCGWQNASISVILARRGKWRNAIVSYDAFVPELYKNGNIEL